MSGQQSFVGLVINLYYSQGKVEEGTALSSSESNDNAAEAAITPLGKTEVGLWFKQKVNFGSCYQLIVRTRMP